MINNFEIVFYTDHYLNPACPEVKKQIQHLKRNTFDNPSVVSSRPLFHEDIEAGLFVDHNYPMLCDEKTPQFTGFMDAYSRLKWGLEVDKVIHRDKFDPTKELAMFIGTNYYDCMSGGLTYDMHLLLVKLCMRPEIRRDGWNVFDGDWRKHQQSWVQIPHPDFLL